MKQPLRRWRRLALAATFALAASPALAQTSGVGGDLGGFIRDSAATRPQGKALPSSTASLDLIALSALPRPRHLR